jgi:hypothetical protein
MAHVADPQIDPEEHRDLVPKALRTLAYSVGTLLWAGVAPALKAAGLGDAAEVALAVAGGFNVLALGYNPLRRTL